MAPEVTVPNVRLLRVEFAGIRKKIESITDPSEKNLNLLKTKKTHLGDLRDRIQRIPAENQSSDFEELMNEILESMWSIDETESDWKVALEHDLVPLPEKSLGSSPPKPKKSKVEEFAERIKGVEKDPVQVSVIATSIIECLERDNKREKNKRRRLQVPMTIRCYVDKIETELGGGLPFLSQADIAGKKPREIEILKRARLWESYLKDKQSSTYISDILVELKTAYDEFKLVHPTVKYEVFCREFCLAIGRVHKQVSERIAHGLDGNSRRVKILKRFDKQTDRYMTIFYNATIGFDKDSDSESEVDLGAGSEDD